MTLQVHVPRAFALLPFVLALFDRVQAQSCYRFESSGETYQGAVDSCAQSGGYLVTINNAQENDLVANIIAQGQQIWIGFNDRADEGNFVWVHGSSSYTNWYYGEPSNNFYQFYGANAENCVLVNWASYGNGWNDWCCECQNAFVCEYDYACSDGNSYPSYKSPTLKPTTFNASSDSNFPGWQAFLCFLFAIPGFVWLYWALKDIDKSDRIELSTLFSLPRMRRFIEFLSFKALLVFTTNKEEKVEQNTNQYAMAPAESQKGDDTDLEDDVGFRCFRYALQLFLILPALVIILLSPIFYAINAVLVEFIPNWMKVNVYDKFKYSKEMDLNKEDVTPTPKAASFVALIMSIIFILLTIIDFTTDCLFVTQVYEFMNTCAQNTDIYEFQMFVVCMGIIFIYIYISDVCELRHSEIGWRL